MHSQHIVLLRTPGSKTAKPLVFAGTQGSIGSMLRAFIPEEKGQYFRVKVRDVRRLCGKNRPVKAIRPLQKNEIPDFVDDLGKDCILTVRYSEGKYKITYGIRSPTLLEWCLSMLAGMFLSEVYHSLESFVRGTSGRPRQRTAVKGAATALLPYSRLLKRGESRKLEVEFNGKTHSSGFSGKDVSETDMVVSLWRNVTDKAATPA
jgi:hypothetical protein